MCLLIFCRVINMLEIIVIVIGEIDNVLYKWRYSFKLSDLGVLIRGVLNLYFFDKLKSFCIIILFIVIDYSYFVDLILRLFNYFYKVYFKGWI